MSFWWYVRLLGCLALKVQGLRRRIGMNMAVAQLGILKGSWDLVAEAINKVTIVIITYNPK